MNRLIVCQVVLTAVCLAGCGEKAQAFPPMPTVKAPFAGKATGACARLPLRFSADGVTAARGENMEFDAQMYRLRVRRRGDPFMMLWAEVPGSMPWGIFGAGQKALTRELQSDGSVLRTGPVTRKTDAGTFRQSIRPDGPGRCAVETEVCLSGSDQNAINGFTVLWEDNNAWRFGTIRVTGAAGSRAFTGESLVVKDPVRLSYETGEPDGTCGLEFPAGLFASVRLHVEKNGVHASLVLAKDRVGKPVRLVYDFGEKAVPAPPGPESVNGTDFREEGDMAYVCWDFRHNVIANPSFESDGRYWHGGKVRTDLARSGRRSMELSGNVKSFALPLAASATNVVSFWARSADGKAHNVHLGFQHWSGADPSLPKGRHFKVPAGTEWTRFEYAFFEPRPAAAITFSGAGVVIDDVQAERGAKASAYTMPPWGFAMENAGEDPYFADAAKPIGAKLVFRGPAGAKGAVDVKVISFFDEDTHSASFPFALGPTGETRFALPDAAFLKGANTVLATVRPTAGAADLRPFTDHVRFSVYTFANGTAKNRTLHQYSSIGSHTRGQLKIPESYFRMMKTTGIAPRCRSVQDGEGVYPPELAKAIVKRYTDIGGMTFGYVWADSVRSGKVRPQFVEKLAARGFANPVTTATMPDPDAFARAVEEVTAEIVGAAPWAEVWIGPDEISGAWKCMSTDDGTLAAKVLMAMHRGVKKGNPKATFICYSTCNSGETARTEYRNFFRAAKKLDPSFRFDAVDPHPYRAFYEGENDVDADWAAIFRLLDECGQPQCVCYSFGGGYAYPLCLTSWNNIAPWAAVRQKDVFVSLGLPGYAMGWGERVAAAMQLRFNLAAYRHAPRLKTNSNWTPWSIDGLNPHAPNVATAAQTELLGDARIYRDVRFAPDCRAYVFDDGHGRATAVFWKFSKDLDRGREQGVTVSLGLAGLDAELFDMMGNRRSAPKDAAGRTVLPLSNYPVYVRVPKAQADRLVAAFERASAGNEKADYDSPVFNRAPKSEVSGGNGAFRLLILGNSTALHSPAPDIGWTNYWGMAASAKEKDFAHLLWRAMEKRLGVAGDCRIHNIYEIERSFFDGFKPDKMYPEDLAWKPDYVVFAAGENAPFNGRPEAEKRWEDVLVTMGEAFRAANPKVKFVLRTPFWFNPPKNRAVFAAARRLGAPVADLGARGDDPSMKALDRGFTHKGVAGHPGDRGMKLMADEVFAALFGTSGAHVYALPDGDPRCDHYRVTVDGQEVPVSAARVSAMPVNIRWPGHQREKDQTEISGFVRFEMSRPVTMTVARTNAFKEVKIRPYSKGVSFKASDRMVTFTLEKPGDYSVEFDGQHENLHVFAHPPSAYAVKKDAPNVRYFGPGVHDVGLIEMKSGETLYIDEGAVVYGRVFAKDADDISILGRGILDMSRIHEKPIPIDPKLAEEQKRKGFAITNVKRWDCIRLEYCDRVKIDGPTLRDSLIYYIRPICCRDIAIRNVKIIGSWRYNADGIDMHNCERVRIADCFVRTYDDAICVKGFDYAMDESLMLHDGYLHDVFRDVLIERCTIWNDWGQQL